MLKLRGHRDGCGGLSEQYRCGIDKICSPRPAATQHGFSSPAGLENPNYSPGKGAVLSWEGPRGVSGRCSPSFWLQRPSRQRSGTQGASSADLKLEDAPNHHSLAIRQVAIPARPPSSCRKPSVALRETLVAPHAHQNMRSSCPAWRWRSTPRPEEKKTI